MIKFFKLIKRIIIHKFWVACNEQTEEQEKQGCLETVFKDGKLVKEYTLAEIRERIDTGL